MSKKFVIGIDEVGRGTLAGPVVVAAVLLAPGRHFRNLKDSKKLSKRQREIWFQRFNKSNIIYALSRVSPSKIDKINISRAANIAAARAFKNLAVNHSDLAAGASIYLDGGLYIKFNSSLRIRCNKIKTVIKGDEKYNCIKIASIIAKVARDRYMKKLHKKYPVYGFDKHKGYGTEAHLTALRKYGYSPVHRLTFIRKYLTI